MPRIARLVVPGAPHHVTQRGNRKERTFFEDSDYRFYLDLLTEAAANANAEVWSYCLMPNHVHIILTPSDADGVRRTFAELHRRYTKRINTRNGWAGHLWQGRFGSVVMDEKHLVAAARYVALNPVRARLVERPQDWRWSSVHAHLSGRDGKLVKVAPVLDRVGDFRTFLAADFDEDAEFGPLRRSETTGRPLGAADWIARLEADAGRPLTPHRRGPKPQPFLR
jgi:putative transposase